MAQGLPVAVYASGPPLELRCQATTTARIYPGGCTTVSCMWIGATGLGSVVVDDRGNGTGIDLECRKDNNSIDIDASCP